MVYYICPTCNTLSIGLYTDFYRIHAHHLIEFNKKALFSELITNYIPPCKKIKLEPEVIDISDDETVVKVEFSFTPIVDPVVDLAVNSVNDPTVDLLGSSLSLLLQLLIQLSI